MHFVGVDGCRGGWIAIALSEAGEASHVEAASIAEVALHYPAALILVDIPIGLRDCEREERRCDVEARAKLGARSSSVFPAPCRPALTHSDYAGASAENQRRTGRRLSKQSFAIAPRILDVEEYLRRNWATGPVIREMHPEVCFWGLAGRPMVHAKRTDEGAEERIAVLARHLPSAPQIVDAASSAFRKTARRDDVVDALVGAVTARLGAESLRTLPGTPERDSRGLRMEMVYTD
jgi:predicted RNase H-like nuclease